MEVLRKSFLHVGNPVNYSRACDELTVNAHTGYCRDRDVSACGYGASQTINTGSSKIKRTAAHVYFLFGLPLHEER